MAYDEYIADRISNVLKQKNYDFLAKRMMGGLCFMVDDKMLCGTHFDKKHNCDLLMLRVGPDNYEMALERPHCIPMTFTGRSMKGYVFVEPLGFDQDEDLEFWIQLCLDFNPLAKSSKKKKRT